MADLDSCSSCGAPKTPRKRKEFSIRELIAMEHQRLGGRKRQSKKKTISLSCMIPPFKDFINTIKGLHFNLKTPLFVLPCSDSRTKSNGDGLAGNGKIRDNIIQRRSSTDSTLTATTGASRSSSTDSSGFDSDLSSLPEIWITGGGGGGADCSSTSFRKPVCDQDEEEHHERHSPTSVIHFNDDCNEEEEEVAEDGSNDSKFKRSKSRVMEMILKFESLAKWDPLENCTLKMDQSLFSKEDNEENRGDVFEKKAWELLHLLKERNPKSSHEVDKESSLLIDFFINELKASPKELATERVELEILELSEAWLNGKHVEWTRWEVDDVRNEYLQDLQRRVMWSKHEREVEETVVCIGNDIIECLVDHLLLDLWHISR